MVQGPINGRDWTTHSYIHYSKSAHVLHGNCYCQYLQILLLLCAYRQVNLRKGKCEDSSSLLHNAVKFYPIENTTALCSVAGSGVCKIVILFLMSFHMGKACLPETEVRFKRRCNDSWHLTWGFSKHCILHQVQLSCSAVQMGKLNHKRMVTSQFQAQGWNWGRTA